MKLGNIEVVDGAATPLLGCWESPVCGAGGGPAAQCQLVARGPAGKIDPIADPIAMVQNCPMKWQTNLRDAPRGPHNRRIWFQRVGPFRNPAPLTWPGLGITLAVVAADAVLSWAGDQAASSGMSDILPTACTLAWVALTVWLVWFAYRHSE
jgi:hypothetical protein